MQYLYYSNMIMFFYVASMLEITEAYHNGMNSIIPNIRNKILINIKRFHQ